MSALSIEPDTTYYLISKLDKETIDHCYSILLTKNGTNH